ncbi:MAG: DUF975 family protein [Oscillospiraceae bacterium]|nr:DUF975 family protein [Oscillospiraceae bacterium]
MDIRNRRAIQNTAAQNLAAAPGDPKNTALVYAGGTALLALAVSIISYLLGLQIDSTGGLGNMGLRSMLSTIQYVLPLAQSVVILCIGFGYDNAVLRMSRRQESSPRTLLDGFRYFGPLFRLTLLQAVIYFAIAFVVMYISAQIFVMTPLADDFWEIMLPLVSSSTVLDSEIMLDDATLVAATEAMLPMIPIFLVLFLAAAAPIYYQYRMANFALLDDPQRGAIAAMRESRTMMKRNRLNLFKLDLSFWWFYLLEALIAVLAYGDTLLPMLGISFPWSDTFSYYLFYVVSLALQVGLYYLFLNRVNVTYATAYEALRPKPQQQNKVVLGNIFEM